MQTQKNQINNEKMQESVAAFALLLRDKHSRCAVSNSGRCSFAARHLRQYAASLLALVPRVLNGAT
jgi:hypothetical protein